MSLMQTITRRAAAPVAIVAILGVGGSVQAQSGASSVFGAAFGQMGFLPLRFNGNAQQSAHGPFVNSNGLLGLTLTPGPHRVGSTYYRDTIDVRRGFTSRFLLDMGGNRTGMTFVIKDPAETRDFAIPSVSNLFRGDVNTLSFNNLNGTVGIAYVPASRQNAGKPTIFVYGPGNGVRNAARQLGMFTIPDSIIGNLGGHNYRGIVQIRYQPDFKILDVFMSNGQGGIGQLIGRINDFTLDDTYFYPSGGQMQLGFIGAAIQRNGDPAENPTFIASWDTGNKLTFDAGLGQNYYNEKFPFQTKKQSVFGTAGQVTWQRNLIKEWNPSPFDASGFTGSGSFRFGGSIHAASDGKLGLIFKAMANGGLADIDYPLNLKMLFPDQNSVAPGGVFTLPTTYIPDASGSLKTTSPTANFTAEFVSRFNVDLDAQAVIFGENLIGNNGQLVDIHSNERNIEFFNVQKILNSPALPIIRSVLGVAGSLQDTEGATGTPKSNPRGTRGKGSKGAAKPGFNPANFLDFSINIPKLEVNAPVGSSADSPRAITGFSQGNVLKLEANFTSALLGLMGTPGEILDMLRKQDISFDAGSGNDFSLGWVFADFYGTIAQDMRLKYDFVPKVHVVLQLSELGGVALPSKQFDLDATTGAVIGSLPTLTMPANGRGLVVTPIVTLDNSFTPFAQPISTFSLATNPFQLYCKVHSAGSSIVDLDSGPAMGFPLSVSISTPPNGDPAIAPFRIGTQNDANNGVVPFSQLTGKSFVLFPTVSSNPQIAYAPGSLTSIGMRNPNAPGVITVRFACRNASQNAVVRFGENIQNPNAGLTTRFHSSTDVEADIPNALLTVPGTYRLTLINGANTTAEFPSNSLTFAVNAPQPALNAVTPAQIVLGTVPSVNILNDNGRQYFEIAASGSNFLPGTVLRWNGQPMQTRVVSSTQLIAEVPASQLAAAGTATIALFTPEPGGGDSAAQTVALLNPVPALRTDGSGLSQTSAAPGQTELTLTVYGSNFMPTSRVIWDGEPRASSVLSDSAISVTLTEAELSRTGTHRVQVRTSAPGGGVSNTLTFQTGAQNGRATLRFNATATRDALTGEVIVSLQAVNASQQDALNLALSALTLNTGTQTLSPTVNVMPALFGTVAKGSTVTSPVTFRFPASLRAGQTVLLNLGGSYSNGTFSARQRMILP